MVVRKAIWGSWWKRSELVGFTGCLDKQSAPSALIRHRTGITFLYSMRTAIQRILIANIKVSEQLDPELHTTLHGGDNTMS